jgi:MoaA/NifB/PqqE/SkfB family radical SAM enzyme
MFGGPPAADAVSALRRAVSGEALNNAAPAELRYLMFKMTNVCNSNCEYCVHAMSNTKGRAKDIPLDVILPVIRQAGQLGAHALSINGGEPLTRPDIFEIIAETVKNRIVPVLMTNGLLLPKYCERLNEAGAWYIIISFDSLNRAVYEKQRGVAFERAFLGIQAAARLKKLNPNVEINVSVVLTKNNSRDIIDTIRFMSERGIATQISPFHNYSPERFDASNSNVERENILRTTEELLDMKRRGYLVSASRGFIEHLPDFFLNGANVPKGYACKTGYTNLFIDTDMSVRPCWSPHFPPLGYINRDTLSDLWHGEKMRGYRRRMLKCECEGCWYMCTGEVEMLLDDLLN